MPIKMNAIERELYKLAKPYLVTRKNDVHVRAALELALDLLIRVGGDRRIIAPAIILHDVGWSMFPEDQRSRFVLERENVDLLRIHERDGVKIARRILKKVNYDSGLIDEILSIIALHDTGRITKLKARSTNEEIVRDADALWRYTKTGFRICIELFRYTPLYFIGYLESKIDQWFFLDISRQIAREQLEERKQEYR